MTMRAELDQFFQVYSGTVIGVEETIRDNFERIPAPGDGRLRALTVHVLLQNLGLFGGADDYLTGIHPRMTELGSLLAKHLELGGYRVSGPEATQSVAIAPHADPAGYLGAALAPSLRPSRGYVIIPPDRLTALSPYYLRLLTAHGPMCGVVTNNGTVIGPDGGLVAAACLIADQAPGRIRLVELGTGAGSTPLALARRGRLNSYVGSDFSPEMVEHFRQTVQPELAAGHVPCRIELCSGQAACLPAADLLSIGVYYQAQPSLMAARGSEMATCLGESGVLIAQSGMMEDRLVTSLLTETTTRHAAWPWYHGEFRLNQYFRYVAEYVIEQETILVATNSAGRFRALGEVCGRAAEFCSFSGSYSQ